MIIENVLENAELKKRYEALSTENWLIPKISKGINHTTIRELIDNWPTATRKELLGRLKIKEHPDYPFLYQDNKEEA